MPAASSSREFLRLATLSTETDDIAPDLHVPCVVYVVGLDGAVKLWPPGRPVLPPSARAALARCGTAEIKSCGPYVTTEERERITIYELEHPGVERAYGIVVEVAAAGDDAELHIGQDRAGTRKPLPPA